MLGSLNLIHQLTVKGALNEWQIKIKKRQNDFLLLYCICACVLLFLIKEPFIYFAFMWLLSDNLYFRQKVIYDVFRCEYIEKHLIENNKNYEKFDDLVYPM